MPLREGQALNQFVKLYRENPERVVFFVGAGLSQPLFPSWQGLIQNLVEISSGKPSFSFDKTALLEQVRKGENLATIADFCFEVLGKQGIRDVLEPIFHREFSIEETPDAYRSLFKLAPSRVITTNYDRVPDVLSRGGHLIFTNLQSSEAMRALESNRKVIFKLHGDVSQNESIVLSSSQYRHIIHSPYADCLGGLISVGANS